MSNEKVIFPESPEAAQYKTGIEGWVDRDGRFWGKDEHMARWCGSTHKKCDCGEIFRRDSFCISCTEAKELEKFKAMPVAEWDGDTPLAIFNDDTFFYEESAIIEYCQDNNIKPSELQVVLCEPRRLFQLNGTEYWNDVLPDDFCIGDVASKELLEAIDKLNTIIRNHPPVSFWPIDKRVDLSHLDAEYLEWLMAMNEDAE